MRKLLILATCVIVLVWSAPGPPSATQPGAAQFTGMTFRTILENDKVRVTRALTSGTMERTSPDGKKTTVEWKAGEVKYFPKETFANKNVGKTEVVLFVTALK